MTRPGAELAANVPLSEQEARQLLSESLARCPADHATAILEAQEESLTRFANNQIHQNVSVCRHRLTLKAVVGRRTGCATSGCLDPTSIGQLADRVVALARLSPDDDQVPEAAPAVAIEPLERFVAATASCTPEERARAVGPVMTAAARAGLEASGALTTASSALAVATSAGAFGYHPDTYARFTCTMRSEDSSGWCDRHRRDWRDLEVERLGARALEKAQRSRAPAEIPPGRYTVVLEPSAVGELVAFLGWLGLGAQSVQEGRSFLSGRLGQRVTGEAVTLVDDARDPRAFGPPFDYEGTPRRRVILIERGVARAVVHDRRTALKAGLRSTGHAGAPPATEGPLPGDLVLAPGDRSLEELIASTEHGVLVTRFWYVRVVDSHRTRLTGMTRDGTFLIERGHVTGGLKNLRFNESVLELLARAEGFGRDAEPTVFEGGGCAVAPALRVRDFHFTGVAPF